MKNKTDCKSVFREYTSGSPLHRENGHTKKLSGKTGNLEVLPKQGILYAQVVNFKILKIKNISIIADYRWQSQITELGTGNIYVWTGQTQ